jgi:hypothetical protein
MSSAREFDFLHGRWRVSHRRLRERLAGCDDWLSLTGTFASGIGTFFGDDTHGGRAIRVRFLWSSPGARSARWEQAFSADGGQTWETNRVMDFAR